MYCYCAFCRNPRTVYRKKSIGLINIFQAISLAGLVSYLSWHKLDAKGLILIPVFMMFAEILIQFRSRLDASCPHCGFDPVLYVKNKEAACERAKKFIEARQNDPDVWLAKKPPLRFPKRKKKGSTRELVI